MHNGRDDCKSYFSYNLICQISIFFATQITQTQQILHSFLIYAKLIVKFNIINTDNDIFYDDYVVILNTNY
jgi:hypothetical protein